jgi:hypothetical protein
MASMSVEAGRIIECGTSDELSGRFGHFATRLLTFAPSGRTRRHSLQRSRSPPARVSREEEALQVARSPWNLRLRRHRPSTSPHRTRFITMPIPVRIAA